MIEGLGGIVGPYNGESELKNGIPREFKCIELETHWQRRP